MSALTGILLFANGGGESGAAAAVTLPAQERLFNISFPLPFTPPTECVRSHDKESCLAKPGCSWRYDIDPAGGCNYVVWEVAGDSDTSVLGNRINPALALGHLGGMNGIPLALIGTRPTDVGNPAVGNLIAIDMAKAVVLWRADNVTAHSIFVDDDAGVAVVGFEAPWDVPFRPANNVSYTLGFRGYSLSNGDVLWDSTSKSSVQHSFHTGDTVGPRACEWAYGQHCGLIAATPLGPDGSADVPSFAMNTSTGESVSPLPSHPTHGYAIDTVNGVEYAVKGGDLTAAAVGGSLLWTAPLPPNPPCLGGTSDSFGLWSTIIVAASKTQPTKQPMVPPSSG
eukprot:SAG25_NODE_1530_length_2835_cov_1.848684_2_plen_339_part_00